jgi:4'-phosphopantetheinyl transferase
MGQALDPGAVLVALADLSAGGDEQAMAAASRLLSPAEKARAARFRFEPDRRLFAVTRALVRHALSSCADVAPPDWRLEPDAHGRPVVGGPAGTAGLRFSAAHTPGLAMCAVSRDRAVGADAERLRADVRLEVARRFFAPAEAEAVRAAPAAEQVERFFTFWTLKESYAKARGLGLSLPLRQFAFVLEGPGPQVSFDPALGDTPSAWTFFSWPPTPEHRAALCVERRKGDEAERIVRWLDPGSGPEVDGPGGGVSSRP